MVAAGIVEPFCDYGTGRYLDLTPELRPSFGNNLFVLALPD